MVFKYLKDQATYFALLIILFVFPLWLFFHFSPYKEPKITFVFIFAALISQLWYFKEKEYRNKIEPKVKKVLHKELKKVPSKQQILDRSGFIIKGRFLCLAIIIVIMLTLMIIYSS